MMERQKCRICDNLEGNRPVLLKATMYGTRGEFEYFRCGRCGCLQIKDEVKDIEKYYDPKQYYSFHMDRRSLKNRLLFAQLRNQVVRFDLLGAMVGFLYPVNYRYLKRLNRHDALLDVGCGDGELLRWMLELGFDNMMGIDPFVGQDIVQEGRKLVVKGDVGSYPLCRKFQMITMIHSLEHVFCQRETIQALDGCLEPGGFLVLQLPVLSEYYWKKYGTNLYTLDPPRHFYIHTKESLQKLMEPFSYRLIDYVTEIDVAIPRMAANAKKGNTERNSGTGFLTGTISSLTSLGLRRRLRKAEDGAIATAVFRKDA